MSLSENLYGRAFHKWKTWREHRKNPIPKVEFDEYADRLTLLASFLSGKAFEIVTARTSDFLVGSTIFFPSDMRISTDPVVRWNVLVFRLVIGLKMMRLMLHPSLRSVDFAKDIDRNEHGMWLYYFFLLPEVFRAIEEEHPRLWGLRDTVFRPIANSVKKKRSMKTQHDFLCNLSHEYLSETCDFSVANWDEIKQKFVSLPVGPRFVPCVLWGMVSFDHDIQALPQETVLPESDHTKKCTEREREAVPRLERVELHQNEIDRDVLIHSFEKLETLDDFNGVERVPDSSDCLEDHEDALKELKLSHVIQTRQTSSSFLKSVIPGACMLPDEIVSERSSKIFYYPEWDFRVKQLKSRWCRMSIEGADGDGFERQAVQTPTIQERKASHQLLASLTKLRNQRTRFRARPFGDSVDLAAVVDRLGSMKARGCGTEKIYMESRKSLRSLSVFILADISLSAESFVGSISIIELTKQCLGVFSETFSRFRDRVGIGAFYSQTRRNCLIKIMKDFDDGWGGIRSKIEALRPTGYTRMGPAIRHATRLLSEEESKAKALIVLSDSKPTDFDAYEGRYGIEDTRHAVAEAEALGISVGALALDARAMGHLRHLYGPENFEILSGVQDVPFCFSRLYRNILNY